MGRRPLFDKALTATERMRRYRTAKRQAEIAAGSRPASKPTPLTATQRWRRWHAKAKAAKAAPMPPRTYPTPEPKATESTVDHHTSRRTPQPGTYAAQSRWPVNAPPSDCPSWAEPRSPALEVIEGDKKPTEP